MAKDKYKEIRLEGHPTIIEFGSQTDQGQISALPITAGFLYPDVELKDTKGQLWDLSICIFQYPQQVLKPIPGGYQGMTTLTVISGKLFHLFNPVSSSAKQKIIPPTGENYSED